MTTPEPKPITTLLKVFAEIDRIRERCEPAEVPPLRPLTIEERLDKLELEQARFGGELLVTQPAMVEAVALVLASAFGTKEGVTLLLENIEAMRQAPNEGPTEWDHDHIAIGRNLAAAALLRVLSALESAVAGAATFAPGSQETH